MACINDKPNDCNGALQTGVHAFAVCFLCDSVLEAFMCLFSHRSIDTILIIAAWSSEMSVSCHIATGFHNSGENNMNLHRDKKQKSSLSKMMRFQNWIIYCVHFVGTLLRLDAKGDWTQSLYRNHNGALYHISLSLGQCWSEGVNSRVKLYGLAS